MAVQTRQAASKAYSTQSSVAGHHWQQHLLKQLQLPPLAQQNVGLVARTMVVAKLTLVTQHWTLVGKRWLMAAVQWRMVARQQLMLPVSRCTCNPHPLVLIVFGALLLS